MDETPDYTDSDTQPELDGRKRRAENNQLQKAVLKKKHDSLEESKVRDRPLQGDPPMSIDPD